MKLGDLFLMAAKARELTGHAEFVVVGSLAVMGLSEHTRIPDSMSMSNDIDAYAKADPERTMDLTQALGESSEFYNEHRFFLDPVIPQLLTLPDDWESRMSVIERDGLRLWFLEPNDTAISKYARGEERDVRWIRAGIDAGIISLPLVRSRLKDTLFLDAEEERLVRSRVDADAAWFDSAPRRKRGR